MGYDFRLAKNNEIDTIFSLYKKRIQWMDKSGIQQWNMTNYLEVYPISSVSYTHLDVYKRQI